MHCAAARRLPVSAPTEKPPRGEIMTRFVVACAALALFASLPSPAPAQQTVKLIDIAELSGAGTTSGTNWKNGIDLAVKEINASGGILGRQISISHYDSQSQPPIAKAMVTKAVDEEPYVLLGPVFSGSIAVSAMVAEQAQIPQIMGGEAANLTQQGDDYLFRTSFSQTSAVPKVAAYMVDQLKVKSVAIVWINNDFGKGGHDEMVKALAARNIKLAADISTEQGQVDYSSVVVKAKSADADALFAYLNEDESARLLRELKKQAYDKPIVGETTLMGQKVIELAGDAADGVHGHVGLTIDAPVPGIQAFSKKYQEAYGAKCDHNGIKGYFGVYLVKAVTEKIGKFDRVLFAKTLHGLSLSAKEYPGLLMDVSFDEHGDLDRESFLVEVKHGQQIVTQILPPLHAKPQ
jgi:branched-chain amino acid transport system substrate-binding protein